MGDNSKEKLIQAHREANKVSPKGLVIMCAAILLFVTIYAFTRTPEQMQLNLLSNTKIIYGKDSRTGLCYSIPVEMGLVENRKKMSCVPCDSLKKVKVIKLNK